MAAAIGLRADYDAARLRELAKRSEDADQTRRLLALAVVYDGGSRSEGAQAGAVGLQTFRDWVLRFSLMAAIGYSPESYMGGSSETSPCTEARRPRGVPPLRGASVRGRG